MRYLVDANVIIQSKDLHYQFSFCQAFWDWLAAAHTAGLLSSIAKVKDELLAGPPTCPGRAWAQAQPAGFFIEDEKDAGVMGEYANVIKWAAAPGKFKAGAVTKFSDKKRADAFLLAAARRHGIQVVTHEKSDPNNRARITIPDAGNALGVKTMTIYDLLARHATGNFTFKP